YYANECRGGCQWTAHVLLGYRGDNPYCHHRAIELLGEGVRERIEKVRPAPGDPFDYAFFEIIREEWPREELELAKSLVATGDGWLPRSISSA
ncbi:MAG: heme biosynthesis protein, partial [Polyangiaceae bacterium]|nr:heme biosynthesis protein [Polyangiaceae bacterium]